MNKYKNALKECLKCLHMAVNSIFHVAFAAVTFLHNAFLILAWERGYPDSFFLYFINMIANNYQALYIG